ncbi:MULTISPECIES: hypothetical protein [Ramlibacter]|uniref:Uncharacterized protein n=1 Tax=Ramlibacter pinisoli TaxID=2682844 RepID=A0A6N8IR74_9BURK|nr:MULTISPECIES: hypothetical protein [Ramlibacter]MBA2963651.1 hypothetical protein [Ramlibacter sp. CGMCC 1.13660]MVQ28616.1 hypothetical protein [Ramlibacter pinisoli]
MPQQPPSNQPDAGDKAPDAPQQEPPQRDADSTWGLGSASALDSLRRQNYRGRRSQQGDDKPSSH